MVDVFQMTACPHCGRCHWSCGVEAGQMVRRCVTCGHRDTIKKEGSTDG